MLTVRSRHSQTRRNTSGPSERNFPTDIDLPTLEKLRARCVQDVRRTHGQISFKDILKFQKEL